MVRQKYENIEKNGTNLMNCSRIFITFFKDKYNLNGVSKTYNDQFSPQVANPCVL